jgi:multidrug efflux system membrane fusion protein
MKKPIKILIPVAIFSALFLLAMLIRANPPEARQRSAPVKRDLIVSAIKVQAQTYQVQLESYGTVQPRTRTTLTAQVSGQVVYVNPNVRDGGFFDKGDVLASIDTRDYQANVHIAQSILMDAFQVLSETKARSVQAQEDWENLGNEGDPPELVIQIPQLEAAKARVTSAKATLQKAELELERTRIIAPFAGRVLQKSVAIGQVVSVNSSIAEIYATDYIEIRLPIRNRDLEFVDLPETYRGEKGASHEINVQIVSELVGETQWDAKLVRTESAIDESARQLHVIAQIDDPFAKSLNGKPQLKIGQYVTARLTGNELENVFVIPNATIYQGSYVYIAEKGLLKRIDIDIAWQNENDAIIKAGLKDGDLLITTPLGQVTSGIRVSTDMEDKRAANKVKASGNSASAPGDTE